MTLSLAPRPDLNPAVQNLQDIEKKLEFFIAETAAAGLHDTVALLQMARLDLLTKMHGITEEELEVLLCTAKLVSDAPVITKSAPLAAKRSPKKSSEGPARRTAKRTARRASPG